MTDEIQQGQKSFLPALAEEISGWFPELDGRALAVSEADVTKENVPTLPLAMVALLGEKSDHDWRSGSITITEDFVIEFWVESERYRGENGSETPFWAYYDYTNIRDRLLNHLLPWVSARESRVAYQSMEIESTHFAVMLSFRFKHEFRWCRTSQDEGDGGPLRILGSVKPKDWHRADCNCKPPQSCGKCNL